MKIRITILFVLATWFVANAQQKRENNFAPVFGSENTKWYTVATHVVDELTTDSIFFSKDSIIDGKNYKAFVFHSPTTRYIRFFLRVSDDNSKLFLFDPIYLSEYVAMDLSLEKGDVFEYKYYDRNYEKITVDTVYYKDNRKHIRFNYIPHCQYGYEDSLMFIEGIGPNYLPLYQEYIRCKYVNDTLQYCGRLADDCQCVMHLASIHNELNAQSNFLISNMVHNHIEFKNITESADITIYSVQGSVVCKFANVTNGNSFDVSGLESGIYFVRIRINNTETTEKIVVTQ